MFIYRYPRFALVLGLVQAGVERTSLVILDIDDQPILSFLLPKRMEAVRAAIAREGKALKVNLQKGQPARDPDPDLFVLDALHVDQPADIIRFVVERLSLFLNDPDPERIEHEFHMCFPEPADATKIVSQPSERVEPASAASGRAVQDDALPSATGTVIIVEESSGGSGVSRPLPGAKPLPGILSGRGVLTKRQASSILKASKVSPVKIRQITVKDTTRKIRAMSIRHDDEAVFARSSRVVDSIRAVIER